MCSLLTYKRKACPSVTLNLPRSTVDGSKPLGVESRLVGRWRVFTCLFIFEIKLKCSCLSLPNIRLIGMNRQAWLRTKSRSLKIRIPAFKWGNLAVRKDILPHWGFSFLDRRLLSTKTCIQSQHHTTKLKVGKERWLSS